ncbi:class III aminotransferase [Natrialba hulunbeirensis JCM 10989]|uniref:Glutamate-1-semialdehyde 2,1-aminomutase n=1 Tax=Natrialba hulunbeirensis JCM 10989 TaxID=1227493 RepID=M0A0C7_9EURY|nr:aspartate aminotransferase family protein [Natrialba hulunbeirensis]ELY91786.1 class III aminotransferase [Natrialba hulunbeirensis JCM 10989]
MTTPAEETALSDELEQSYVESTPRSRELAERARDVMPGGDTRSVTYVRPYPSYVESAHGAQLETVDGETLLDVLNNYTQSVLGHTPEPVVDDVCTRFRAGNGVAAPTEPAVELAELLVGRVPSVEQVRFCNSGTEATMNAIRAAMAWTQNERVCKITGGYHGTHDVVEVGVADEGREHTGIPRTAEQRVQTVSYNDTDQLKATFEAVGDDLACLILEPILGVGGMIPATDEFLHTARDLTAETDTPLIFDEMMSFRLAPGGAQQRRVIEPDLTAFGKLIGGGLPVGAVGGRADLMAQFHPETGSVDHSGTFNANPATMAGGVATLRELDADAIETLNQQGADLRTRLQEIGDDADQPITITGEGSLFQIHFTDGPVRDLASSAAGDPAAEQLFHELRREGVFIAPRGMGNLSTPMTDSDLDQIVTAFDRALESIAESPTR